jgi:FtsP/CotA-like multicopper oxidase with cupredoxin domain
MNIKRSFKKSRLLTTIGLTFGLFLMSSQLTAEPIKNPAIKSKSHTTKPTGEKPAAAAAQINAIKPTTVLKYDAKEVNGAKVWLPKQATANEGETLTLEVHNSLDAPHGFKIDGYVPQTAIGAGETKTFTITPKQKGTLKVTCHLHPAHVGAEIRVQ